jgi:large subunit ribosomal protein L7/L12
VGVWEIVVIVAVVLVLLTIVRVRRRPAAPPPVIPAGADIQTRVRMLCAAGRKIQAIKEFREATGLGLADAKHAVDTIESGGSLPVPPAAPPGAPPGAGARRPDLAARARSLAAAGRTPEAIRLIADETGMSAPEATAFLAALEP